ncbi:hypothetical protein GCM10009733_013150 [Nonomuraea maheshkhaliensis]|uniref:SH3 domain-containing protein n=1 Tax=Nonomuraea maheshkhaliensis TaxID=419590 RepID=A0ABN2EUC2_9ACTN
MRRAIVRLGTTVAAMALLGATLGGTPAQASAQGGTCTGWSHGNYDDGWDTIGRAGNMKKGPYSSCGNVKYLSEDTTVYFHCKVINGYGKVWVYVRVAGTTTEGWVSYDNLYHWSTDLIETC